MRRFLQKISLAVVSTLFIWCKLHGDCAPLLPSMVEWWRGEDTKGFIDSQLGSFRASAKVGDGFVGGGFELGGNNDAVLLPPTFQFDSQEFTVEAWIKRGDIVHAGLPVLAGEIFAGSANGFAFGLVDEGLLYISHIGVANYYSTTQIRDLNWHHVAVTRVDGKLSFYLDGVPAGTAPCAVQFDLSGPYAIGGLGTPFAGIAYGFLGKIDELSLYRKALTADQVKVIHAAGASVKCVKPPVACVEVPAGLVGWWRGDSASDTSGSVKGTFRRNGRVSQGFIGGGFEFAGNEDALLLPSSFRLPSQEFTIETWIKRSDTVHAGLPFIAGEFFAGAANSFSFGLMDQGNLYLSHIGIASYYSTTRIVDTHWHHVAVTRKNGSLQFFLDGVLASVVACPVTFDLDGPFAIGGLAKPFDGISYGFLGNIDELAVYSRALDAAELANIFTVSVRGKCGPPTDPTCFPVPGDLVAWYRGENDSSDWARGHGGIFENAQYAAGKVGASFDLNGTNEVRIQDFTLPSSDALTLEAWVYPTAVDGDVDVILAKEGESSSPDFALGIKGSASVSANSVPPGNLVFSLGGLAGAPLNYLQWTDTGASLPLNAWSHVALVRGVGFVTAYVNGLGVTNFPGVSGSLKKTTAVLKIGARSDSVSQLLPLSRFNGRVDEVAVYARALDAYEILSVVNAGNLGKCSQPDAVDILQLSADQRVDTGAAATFSVDVAGTRPMSFQWQFNDGNIPGGTEPQLVVTNISKLNAGNYRVVVCNPAGCVTSAPVRLTVMPPPAVVRVAEASTKAPSDALVPIVLVGNGLENAISFNLRFDPRVVTFIDAGAGAQSAGAQFLVNATSSSSGVVSIAIALPSGLTFGEGTNEVAMIRLRPGLPRADFTTQVGFSELPTVQRIVDPSAATLPAIWRSGPLLIKASEFEGDVNPRGAPDRSLNVSDWVQLGRIVAGLDEILPGSEFQRADCAPLATSGNGVISVADWVQAGRYAVGLDPLRASEGPDGSQVIPNANKPVPQSPVPDRVIHLTSTEINAGQDADVSVVLDAAGDENAIAFSLRFDTNLLRFTAAFAGAGAQNAVINSNLKDAGNGRIGFAMALPTGSRFGAGAKELARLRFKGTMVGSVPAELAFSDSPILREVANPTADALAGQWLSTSLKLVGPLVSISTRISNGNGLEIRWPISSPAAVLESAIDSQGPWETESSEPLIDGAAYLYRVTASGGNRFFRLRLR